MQKFKSVEELIKLLNPVNPVYCIRPGSIKKSVDFFKNNFPGEFCMQSRLILTGLFLDNILKMVLDETSMWHP